LAKLKPTRFLYSQQKQYIFIFGKGCINCGETVMPKERQREKVRRVAEKSETGGQTERERESIHINFCCWQLAPLIKASYRTHSKRKD
jgi:hypothetical protein